MNKMSDNQKRGQRNIISLKNAGWNVITVWECQLHSSVREEILNNVVRELENAI